jgi:hypothetical protein
MSKIKLRYQRLGGGFLASCRQLRGGRQALPADMLKGLIAPPDSG